MGSLVPMDTTRVNSTEREGLAHPSVSLDNNMRKESLYLTEKQIDAAVRKMYEKSGCIVLSGVRNGTGFAKQVRTADMLAVSTWPSRGLWCEGIEIKSTRSDLGRELATPAKAEDIARYCRNWWLAVPTGLVADPSTIPETWGIITVDDKLRAKVSRRGAVLKAVPMDTLMVCSVLRTFAETYIHCSEIAARIAEATEKARQAAESNLKYRQRQMELAVGEFRDSSGIDLMSQKWSAGQIGSAVKLLVALRSRPVEEIARAQASLTAATAAIDEALAVLDEPLKEPGR